MASKLSNFSVTFWIFIPIFLKDVHNSHTFFTGVTDQVLGGPLNGLIATFGDFNMDKNTDVFAITDNGHKVELYMKNGNGSYLLDFTPQATIERLEDTITNVAGGDFNGDFQMDVLITTKPNSDPFDMTTPTKAFVYWGDVVTMQYKNWTLVTDQLIDQPLVMDYNADMIPDLFGAVIGGQKKFWTRRENNTRTFREVNLPGREDFQLVVPNSNAFLDVTGNYAANLVMTTTPARSNGTPPVGVNDTTFEVWSYVYVEGEEESENVWMFSMEYAPPQGVKIEHLGVSTFADMNADSLVDHILPVCYNTICSKGAIYVRFQGTTVEEWTLMFNLTQLHYDDSAWGFVPPSAHLTDFTVLPLVIRTGDYNLDTYTDLIILTQATVKGVVQRRSVVLENMAGQSLAPSWASDPYLNIASPVLAAFIDIQRTGQLDILIVNQTVEQVSQIYLMENTLAVDAYFVKVEVLSGLCKKVCPQKDAGNTPYGVNQPGPTVRYDTTSSTGQPQRDGGSQLSQSAYFSLQLPYVLLGLGQNPNFVDYLRVGVPGGTVLGVRNKRVHEWTSVIPNSQLIIVPFPLDDPNDWISKIIIIPGQSVVLTAVVLICTGTVLALTAALLHLKERKDDEKEKRQDAHRFHFDGM